MLNASHPLSEPIKGEKVAFCTEATDDYHKKSLKVVAVQIMRGGPCNKKRFNYTCPFFIIKIIQLLSLSPNLKRQRPL